MSAAIWPWLARKELASAAVTLTATGPLTHLLERSATVAEQVDQCHTLGSEELEGKPHPLRRILDAGKGVSDVGEQVLAPPQVAAPVAQRNAHLRESILCLARALCRLRRPRRAPDEVSIDVLTRVGRGGWPPRATLITLKRDIGAHVDTEGCKHANLLCMHEGGTYLTK
jgi:hypothetical protein